MLKGSSCLIIILLAAAGFRAAGDDSLISVQRHRIMVGLSEGELKVSEVFMAINNDVRAIVPKDAELGSFRIPLPAGAINIRTSGDIDPKLVQITDRQAVYASEFRPGSMQFVLQYSIRCNQPKLTFTWPVAYKTDQIDFIFPDDIAGASVNSTDFDQQRVVTMGQRRYHYLIARSKQPGSLLTVAITVPVAPRNVFKWPALAIAMIVSAAIVILKSCRGTRRVPLGRTPSAPTGRKGATVDNGTGV
ncbi:MAG TPA: hypothetical protein VM223_12515 [Planctomycetota bacterium]|nr:hypothetical protein [Planctomycetota bacterium]